jgi:hypothetical protein
MFKTASMMKAVSKELRSSLININAAANYLAKNNIGDCPANDQMFADELKRTNDELLNALGKVGFFNK